KDKDINNSGTSNTIDSSMSVNFKFQNVVNGEPLVLKTGNYKNENGDDFTVTDYRYYISNIVLHTEGSEYTEPESYHLVIQEKEDSKSFTIKGIPEGAYTKMSFLIGVDS